YVRHIARPIRARRRRIRSSGRPVRGRAERTPREEGQAASSIGKAPSIRRRRTRGVRSPRRRQAPGRRGNLRAGPGPSWHRQPRGSERKRRKYAEKTAAGSAHGSLREGTPEPLELLERTGGSLRHGAALIFGHLAEPIGEECDLRRELVLQLTDQAFRIL